MLTKDLAHNAATGGHNKPHNQSVLGGLAGQFLGGQGSHGNSGHGGHGGHGGGHGGGSGGLAGQLIGGILGGGKPHSQQHSEQHATGSGGYGGSSSGHQSGGLMGFLGGQHGSSVSLHAVYLWRNSKNGRRIRVITMAILLMGLDPRAVVTQVKLHHPPTSLHLSSPLGNTDLQVGSTLPRVNKVSILDLTTSSTVVLHSTVKAINRPSMGNTTPPLKPITPNTTVLSLAHKAGKIMLLNNPMILAIHLFLVLLHPNTLPTRLALTLISTTTVSMDLNRRHHQATAPILDPIILMHLKAPLLFRQIKAATTTATTLPHSQGLKVRIHHSLQ